MTTFTKRTKPTPSQYIGLLYVSDDGPHGKHYISDGAEFTEVDEATVVINQQAVGWLVPSLVTADAATYSQAGTVITVTSAAHGIPATIHNGKDVYLKMGTKATGAQLVAGWFTDFTYVDANTFTCVSATSQIGTGAVLTNLTATIVTPVSTVIEGGLIGSKGRVEVSYLATNSTSVNDKTYSVKLNTSLLQADVVTTDTISHRKAVVQNVNSEAKQITGQALGGTYGGAVSTALRYTENTAVNSTVSLTVQLEGADEYIAIETFNVDVMPS